MNKKLLMLSLSSLLLAMPLMSAADPAPDFTKLIKKTSPSVVSVEVSSTVARSKSNPLSAQIEEQFQKFFGGSDSPFSQLPSPFGDSSNGADAETFVQHGEGSGFIISKEGYILTNAHVISGADYVDVLLKDRQEYRAKVIGIDERTDIALLQIDGKDLPVAKLGDSDDVQVGDWVLAIGSPFGFEATATKGIVSAINRDLSTGTYTPFIQTDAAINPGNSGGPLFNSHGEVIGINSQIYSKDGAFNGIGFAIPIDVAKNIANQLMDNGEVKRGWLGVAIQNVDQNLAKSFNLDKPMGALISQVVPDSPAEKYGLKAGDIILSFNDKKITKASDLSSVVAISPIDEPLEVEIIRNGERKKIDVTIGKNNEQQLSEDNGFGMTLQGLDADVKKSLQYSGDDGVVITKILPNSSASKAGLKVGDIILSISGKEIQKVSKAVELLGDAEKDQPLPLLIYRKGMTVFLAFVPEK